MKHLMKNRRYTIAFIIVIISSLVAFYPLHVTANDSFSISNAVSHWDFNEGSGNSAHDNIRENHGTLMGGPVWVEGVEGAALYFDGLDDHVKVPKSESLRVTGGQISVEFWMKPGEDFDSSTRNNLVNKGNEYTFQIGHDGYTPTPDGKLWFAVILGPGYNWEGIQSTRSFWEEDVWYHIAGVYDGSSINLYVDGELENSRPLSGNLLAGGVYDFHGGGGLSPVYYNGAIDELKIFDYALTDNQITEAYSRYLFGHPLEWISLTNIPHNAQPSYSQNGEKIAYLMERSSHWHRDIWIMDADGSNKELLVTDTRGGGLGWPDWSPDANKIVYAEYYHDSRRDIMTIDVNTKQITPVITNFGSIQYPRFSPDGTEIVFVKETGIDNNYWTVFIVNLVTQVILPVTSGEYRYSCLDWSPDGSMIVVQRNTDIVILDEDGSNERILVDNGRQPVFHPEGNKVLFWRDNDLYSIDITTEEIIQITDCPLDWYIEGYGSVSPNGVIAFSAAPLTNTWDLNIYRINDNTNTHEVIQNDNLLERLENARDILSEIITVVDDANARARAR